MSARKLTYGGAAAFLVIGIALFAMSRGEATVGAACGSDCAVSLNGNRYDNHNGGTFTYCFVGSYGFSDDQKAAIVAGMNYWVAAFSENPNAPSLSIVDGGGSNCDLNIYQAAYTSGPSSVVAAGLGNSNGGVANMIFNTNFSADNYTLGNMTLGSWEWVAAHEFGHVIGFNHMTGTSCDDTDSVMYPYVNPARSQGPPSTTHCVDIDGTNQMFSTEPGDDIVQPEVHENDWICDFHYTVTYYIAYWGGSWHITGESWTLSYIDNCVPRMEG